MNECIFCQIIKKKVQAEIIFENEEMIVIKDEKPRAPVHLLVISKKHIESLNELEINDLHLVGRMIFQIKELVQSEKIAQDGYKTIINCGQHGGQVVPHLHMHVLGGEPIAGIV